MTSPLLFLGLLSLRFWMVNLCKHVTCGSLHKTFDMYCSTIIYWCVFAWLDLLDNNSCAFHLCSKESTKKAHIMSISHLVMHLISPSEFPVKCGGVFIRGYLESFGRRHVLAASAGKPQLSDGKAELRQPHSRTATPKVQRETEYANGSMNGHEWSVPSYSLVRIRWASAGTHSHLHAIITLPLLTSRLLHNHLCFFSLSLDL